MKAFCGICATQGHTAVTCPKVFPNRKPVQEDRHIRASELPYIPVAGNQEERCAQCEAFEAEIANLKRLLAKTNAPDTTKPAPKSNAERQRAYRQRKKANG